MLQRELIDVEFYDYVMDKGPITSVEVGSLATDITAMSSFRIFGLKKGAAAFAELKGHYFVNTTGSQGEDIEMSAVQLLELPALVKFQDPGQAARIGIEWKFMNSKLYAITIPSDVWVKSSDGDSDGKWVSEKDARPVKLEVLSAVEPLANRDGVPMLRNFESWMSQRSDNFFKMLKIENVSQARAWCRFSEFAGHVELVAVRAEKALRDEVEGTIESDTQNILGKRKKSAAQIPLTESQQQFLDKRMAVLKEALKELVLHLHSVAVPLEQRIIELDFDHEAPAKTLEEFVRVSSQCSKEKAEQLAALLRKADKLELLRKSQARLTFKLSPLKALAPSITAADDEGESNQIADNDSNVGPPTKPEEQEPDGESEPGSRASKRQPKPIERLIDLCLPPSKGTNATSATKPRGPLKSGGQKLDFSKPDEVPQKPPRPYNRTGLHSKDPAVAAAARQKHLKGGGAPKIGKCYFCQMPNPHSLPLTS